MSRTTWWKKPAFWLAVGGLALLVLAAACVRNPVTGENELSFMGEAEEIALGIDNYPKTTQMNNGLPADDPGLQSYVSQVGSNLASHSHRPALPWAFNVVNSSEINAFALPGGKISFTRGILTKMNSEDEMAFVMGHEIGHVAARHSAQQYTKGVLISAALAGVGVALSDSDWQGVGLAVSGVAGQLLLLSYSRDMERQADDLGMNYMAGANYNPKATLQVFQIFQSQEKSEPGMIQAWLSSHPLTSERINLAQQQILQFSPRLTEQPYKTSRFQKMLALQKDRAPAYAAMDQGDLALKKKNYGAAASDFQKAIGLFPREGLFHTRLAVTRLEQEQPKQAVTPAKNGVRYSPNLFLAQFVLGVTCRQTGDQQGALKAFGAAQRILPNQPLNTLLLANTFDRLGQRREAVLLYQRVARLDKGGKMGNAAVGRLRQLGY
ncbi:MAG: M48 family metalloprotease [Deltaproteobacteria bacterium]|nr:M48 family metalloprotease [Deltaproteobacteria bacterium]